MSEARLKLIIRLGGKCSECGENHPSVLQVDHKLGQGYIEKSLFKTKEEMYEQYLNEFEKESEFLQVLCFNCNIKKRLEKSETQSRPQIEDFDILYKTPFNEVDVEELVDLMFKYPQFKPSLLRQARMIKKIAKEELDHRKSNEMQPLLTPTEQVALEPETDLTVLQGYPRSEIARNQLFMDIVKLLEGDHKSPVEEKLLIRELVKSEKFTEEEARSFLRKRLREADVYESRPGFYNNV